MTVANCIALTTSWARNISGWPSAASNSASASRTSRYYRRARPAAIAAAKAEAQQEMEKQAAATKSAAAAAANQAIVDDMCSDPAWAQTLQELHDRQPVVGLKEALTPTFALFRQNYAADYGDWTDQHFLDNIDQSIANMGTKLKDLGISDQYDVELAAGINIYTKQFPAWYWLMNDEFNNTNARGQGGGKGKSKGKGSASLGVQVCIPFSKFLMNALQKLPEQFIHRAGCIACGVSSGFSRTPSSMTLTPISPRASRSSCTRGRVRQPMSRRSTPWKNFAGAEAPAPFSNSTRGASGTRFRNLANILMKKRSSCRFSPDSSSSLRPSCATSRSGQMTLLTQ